ncbi:MAG: tetratricopeptide repeat protein [Candidatus Acidiferrales bacterium]
MAIESKGLPEFDPENNKSYDVSSQDEKIFEAMTPIITLIGNKKDAAKDSEAMTGLSSIIRKYPEYSDAYFLRATVSIAGGGSDYQEALSDIDAAIRLRSSAKYKKVYDSPAEMYAFRAKVDMLADNDQQAMKDMEVAVESDPSTNPFNSGGVKPEEDADPTALQKKDFDSLAAQYPNDYRVYMFRGLFYTAFTTYDEQYYAPALNDLEHAQNLNPNSAYVDYFLGTVYQKEGFWTKAAWADISASGGYKDKANAVALQYFDAAVKLDPRFTEALAQVAESLFSLRQYAEAIPYYDKVIELDPNRAGAYNDRGLAKTYTNDYYGAISDFSQTITLEGEKALSPPDNTFENRADAYMKVNDYGSAAADYSRAIGSNFASQLFLMSLPQIRAIYPEFKGISDEDLLEGLRQKYYPNMKPSDFVSQYQKNRSPFEDFILAGLYDKRGTSYLNAGDFRRASIEYARALSDDHTYSLDRWKPVSKDADSETDVDVQTLNFAQGNMVSLWIKTSNASSQTNTQTNYEIDCSGTRIKSLGSFSYNSAGNPTESVPEGEWQVIVPEAIGEILHNGMCSKSSSPQ